MDENIKVCTTKELERKRKFAEAREWVERKTKEALEWAANNKEFVIVTVVPTAIAIGGKVIKTAKRDSQIRKEQDLKDLYIYDRSMGHYWELKRKLKPSEWQTFERRKANGERVGEILQSMRVLK